MLSPETNYTPTHELDHIVDQLRRPDPTIGWTGDPLLTVAYNRILDRWEVHRERPDGSGKFDFIARQKEMGQRLDVTQLLRGLVARDTTLRNNTALDQANERIKANQENEKRLDAEAAEQNKELTLKLTRGIITDLGEGSVGYVRPLTVPDLPWHRTAPNDQDS